jgi:hypothetical protein
MTLSKRRPTPPPSAPAPRSPSRARLPSKNVIAPLSAPMCSVWPSTVRLSCPPRRIIRSSPMRRWMRLSAPSASTRITSPDGPSREMWRASGRMPASFAPLGTEPASVGQRLTAGTAEVVDVHRRCADELGHEAAGGVAVKLHRRADLLDPALGHDDDPVGEAHRLHLVVGDEDEGGAEARVKVLQFGAQLGAQFGVEVRQRLVEEEHGRLAHDGAAHGDALALPARERAGLAVEIGSICRVRAASAMRRSISASASPGSSARIPCSCAPSCAGRARSSGTPWRCRVRPVRAGSPPGRRWRPRPR